MESKVSGGAAKPAEIEVPGETAELERATPDEIAELESKVPGGAAKPAEIDVPGETAELERATPEEFVELESKVPGGAAKPAEIEVSSETAELEIPTPDEIAELECTVSGVFTKLAERVVLPELAARPDHCSSSSCGELTGMFQALVVGAGASTTSGNIPLHCLQTTHSLLLSPSTLLCTLPLRCSSEN